MWDSAERAGATDGAGRGVVRAEDAAAGRPAARVPGHAAAGRRRPPVEAGPGREPRPAAPRAHSARRIRRPRPTPPPGTATIVVSFFSPYQKPTFMAFLLLGSIPCNVVVSSYLKDLLFQSLLFIISLHGLILFFVVIYLG